MTMEDSKYKLSRMHARLLSLLELENWQHNFIIEFFVNFFYCLFISILMNKGVNKNACISVLAYTFGISTHII